MVLNAALEVGGNDRIPDGTVYLRAEGTGKAVHADSPLPVA